MSKKKASPKETARLRSELYTKAMMVLREVHRDQFDRIYATMLKDHGIKDSNIEAIARYKQLIK